MLRLDQRFIRNVGPTHQPSCAPTAVRSFRAIARKPARDGGSVAALACGMPGSSRRGYWMKASRLADVKELSLLRGERGRREGVKLDPWNQSARNVFIFKPMRHAP